MDILSILTVAIRHAGPIALIAMGGLLASKANVFNLALEGFTLISCFASIVGAYYTNSVLVGVLAGVLASTLLILVYAPFFTQISASPGI